MGSAVAVTARQYDPPLDPGIKRAVEILNSAGVETFESCDGSPGHAYPEPTVRFYGNRAEGIRALAVAMQAGLEVTGLRRVWPVLDGEPTGPWWELTFLSDLADSSERTHGKAASRRCQCDNS